MKANASAALILTLVLRAAVSLPLASTAPGPLTAILPGGSRTTAGVPAPSMRLIREGVSSTPETSQESFPRMAPGSSGTVAGASLLASAPIKTSQAMNADPAGVTGDDAAGGSPPGSSQAAGSVPGSGSLAGADVASGAPQPQISANDTTSLGGPESLVFDGMGHQISGGTGFGDSPPKYTGKQAWPELVGENAALAKAQLLAETQLLVILVPAGSAVTTDYRTNKIRIFYDPTTLVVVQPSPAIG